MKADLLKGPFAVAEKPGLPSDDQRMTQIIELIEKDDIEGAAAIAESLIEDGHYDVRLVCVVLLETVRSNGIIAISELFGLAPRATPLTVPDGSTSSPTRRASRPWRTSATATTASATSTRLSS